MFTQASICIRMYVHYVLYVYVYVCIYTYTCVRMQLHLYVCVYTYMMYLYMYDWCCSISSFNGITYQNFPGQQGHSTYLKS